MNQLPISVQYENGTQALFSSVGEAQAQADHDAAQPGHLNPVSIVSDGQERPHEPYPCPCDVCAPEEDS